MSWAQRAEAEVAALAASHEPFTADDLLARIGPPDVQHSPNARNNAVGSVFARAHRAHLIEVVGHTQSRTPTRKGGLIRVWRGASS